MIVDESVYVKLALVELVGFAGFALIVGAGRLLPASAEVAHVTTASAPSSTAIAAALLAVLTPRITSPPPATP